MITNETKKSFIVKRGKKISFFFFLLIFLNFLKTSPLSLHHRRLKTRLQQLFKAFQDVE